MKIVIKNEQLTIHKEIEGYWKRHVIYRYEANDFTKTVLELYVHRDGSKHAFTYMKVGKDHISVGLTIESAVEVLRTIKKNASRYFEGSKS